MVVPSASEIALGKGYAGAPHAAAWAGQLGEEAEGTQNRPSRAEHGAKPRRECRDESQPNEENSREVNWTNRRRFHRRTC